MKNAHDHLSNINANFIAIVGVYVGYYAGKWTDIQNTYVAKKNKKYNKNS